MVYCCRSRNPWLFKLISHRSERPYHLSTWTWYKNLNLTAKEQKNHAYQNLSSKAQMSFLSCGFIFHVRCKNKKNFSCMKTKKWSSRCHHWKISHHKEQKRPDIYVFQVPQHEENSILNAKSNNWVSLRLKLRWVVIFWYI